MIKIHKIDPTDQLCPATVTAKTTVMLSFIRSVVSRLVTWVSQQINHLVEAICRPAEGQTLTSAVLDLSRNKPELIPENALLRHQLVLLKRAIKRPTLKPKDRLSLLLLAKVTRTWRQVLFIVQPSTLLRWHREGFRLFWRLKSKPAQRQPRLSSETINLIRQMACENPLWGAERIRGELLKLGIHVSKQTVQRYRGQRPSPGQSSQTWSTFLKMYVPQTSFQRYK